MGTTVNNLTENTTIDATNDELVLYDNSASILKKISPANFRDSLFTGSAIASVDDTTLTASRALASNSSGEVAVSAVTSTELGYVSGVTSAIQGQLDSAFSQNLVYNSNFDMWTRGTSFTNISDDTYFAPGWYCLTNIATVDIAQATASPPTGSTNYCSVTDVSSPGNAALVFILESELSVALQGKSVSLGVQTKKTGTLSSIALAIYSWTGTADSPTSDLVSSWAAVPPTSLAANWTLEGSTTGGGASWAQLTLDNVSLDTASIKNIAVFIQADNQPDGSASGMDITQVSLTVSAAAGTYVPPLASSEVHRAQRRYLRLTGDGSGNGPQIAGYAGGTETHKYFIPFPTTMRTTPTSSVGGTWNLTNCTGPTLTGDSPQGTNFTVTASGSGAISAASNGTDDYLEFDAEL